ncbi:MAG: hypothetical protein JW974_02810 [Alphaproteobacteria bacterium]|nr:hypothetical protein [Alphaproteobacteria bacterium]MBN2675583.1 hypothetical protein [Alphaproteobacteria bacterium]
MKKKFTVIILSTILFGSVTYNVYQIRIINKFKKPVKRIAKIYDSSRSCIEAQEKELIDINCKIKTNTVDKKNIEKGIRDINNSFYKYPMYSMTDKEKENWENLISSKFTMNLELQNKLKSLNKQDAYLDSLIGRLNIEKYYLDKKVIQQKASVYTKFLEDMNTLKQLVKESVK